MCWGQSQEDGLSGDSDHWHFDGCDWLVHGHRSVCIAHVESDCFCWSQHHHSSDGVAGHVDELCGAEYRPDAV